MNTIELVIYKMKKRLSKLRKNYKKQPGEVIVPNIRYFSKKLGNFFSKYTYRIESQQFPSRIIAYNKFPQDVIQGRLQ